MKNIDRQIEREKKHVEHGVERFYANYQARKGTDGGAETGMEGQILSEVMAAIVPRVTRERRKALKEIKTLKGRPSPWSLTYQLMSPYQAAYITAKGLMVTAERQMSRRRAATFIGRIIETQIKLGELKSNLKLDNDDKPSTLGELTVKRIERNANPKVARKWLGRITELVNTDWDRHTAAAIGWGLINIALDEASNIFTEVAYMEGPKHSPKTVLDVQFTDEARERIYKGNEKIALNSVIYGAMVVPPKPWTFDGQRWDGGYYTLRNEIFLGVGYNHTDDDGHYKAEVSDEMASALNHIQGTPWRVNRKVFEAVQGALDANMVDLIGFEPEKTMPERLSDNDFNELDEEQRKAVKGERAETYRHNATVRSKVLQLMRQLAIADELVDEPEIYFPHTMDFRGRVYPIPTDLNPQGSDAAKAMLTFATGKPLGEHGLKHLSHHVANAFGKDKVSKIDQLKWIQENVQLIMTVASDPLGTGREFLAEAEDTWQFLASAIDLAGAMSSDDPEAYVSSVPVAIDGSNNGLQHLSAMSGDVVGATATNLVGSLKERRDVYTEVLTSVNRMIDLDVTEGVEEAINWQGKTTRKTVKRSVMTRAYGLTKAGCLNNIMKDSGIVNVPGGRVRNLDGRPMANALYMRDKIWDAMTEVTGGADKIMSWLQGAAEELARREKPVIWTTPAKMKVVQWYKDTQQIRFNTVAGSGKFNRGRYYGLKGNGLTDKGGQIRGIAPNVVHSIDAAHMALTVIEAGKVGVGSFAMIHDSFGTHAADMECLTHKTREVFHSIYSVEVINNLYRELRTQSENIDQPPAKGEYGIDEVLTSDYFFA